MARVPQQTRLALVASAGAEAFGRLGYRRTRMADVATAAGLSAGAIYTYVESKEALFHLVLLSLLEDVPDSSNGLPLATPPFADTLALIDRQLRAHGSAPALRAAAKRQVTEDARAELAEIVAEHYAMLQRLWPALAVIERCAVDLPELHEFYIERRRRGHQLLFGEYVANRIASGQFAAFSDPQVAAQLAIETITWFAWHRVEGFDRASYDDHGETGRQTVTEFVGNALICPSGSTTADATSPLRDDRSSSVHGQIH
jgi:AcrR family transcriptional regulator